ncbi:MAG: hypothetical protein ACRDIB_06345, partial [Ardenticatenaceae bacterium]
MNEARLLATEGQLDRPQERPSGGSSTAPAGLTRLEVLSTAVCAFALATGFLGGFFGISEPGRNVLYSVAYLSGGFFGAVAGLRALRRGALNVDFLMVLAALGAASIGEWAEGATLL